MPVHVKSAPESANGELIVSVSGELGFEPARELLFVCRDRWDKGARSIRVDFQGVTGIGSSAIGTLVLLSELAGDNRFSICLNDCSDSVRSLFNSGLLDKYFHGGMVKGDE